MLIRFSCNKGFTIIELTVVMLIIALFAAMTMPGLSRTYAKQNLQLAALQLQQEIRTLGQESLKREWAGYQITFYATREYYNIKGPEGTRKVTLPARVELVETNFDVPSPDQMNFSARGMPTRGGHIALRNTVSGEFKYVIVAAITGRTRISDTPPDE